MNVRNLVLLGGLIALVWAIRNWRTAVKAALVLVVVEGAIRKWVLPGAQDLVYFGKDVLLLSAYAGFLSSGASRAVRGFVPPGLMALLIATASFGALQILNPHLPTPLLGILGFKAYFLYIPLLWVLPAVFPDDQSIARFLKRTLLLAVPVCLLAFAQFMSPGSSWVNTYARGATDRAITFGSSTFVRVTGTFSFISGFASYLVATSTQLLGLLATTGWKLTSQMWLLICLGFTLTAMLMTGSRGPVVTLALILPLYWFFSLFRERQAPTMFLRFIVGGLLLFALSQWAAPQALEAFVGRASGGGATEVGRRGLTPLLAPLAAAQGAGLLGYGIGASHPAAMAVVGGTGDAYWLQGNLHEAETGKVMTELGPIGFILWYATRISLIAFAFFGALRLKTRFHRSMAIACALYLLSQLLASTVFDPTAGLYQWYAAGLVTTMMALDRRVIAQAQKVVAPIPDLSPDFSHRPLVANR